MADKGNQVSDACDGRNFASRLLNRALSERKKPAQSSERWFDFGRTERALIQESERSIEADERELAASLRK